MGQSSSQVKVTSRDRSILDLKIQRDKIKQYQKRIQLVLDREKEIAREALAQGNKKKALVALRQRKYQESLLNQTDGQLETLQQLVATIEFALVEKDVMYGLKEGNKALKQLNQEMSVEDVERLLGDTEEAVAYQNEISESLNSRMSAQDETDVQRELEELQREQRGEASASPATSVPQADVSVDLPSVPQGELPPVSVSTEETEPEERQAIPA